MQTELISKITNEKKDSAYDFFFRVKIELNCLNRPTYYLLFT